MENGPDCRGGCFSDRGGDGIFRHKVLQEIALGDSSERVEEVLGVPDEEKEGASFYFEDEYLDLRELELEYNEGIVSPDPNLPFPNDPVSTYPEYVQVVERLQNGKFKSIEIGYAPWGTVEKVICNVGFNRIDMQVKKLKEYSLLDSGYLKGMSVYPLRYTATYEDGSYVLRSFSLPVDGFDYETADRSSLAWAASELQNDPKVLEAKYFPANGVPAYDRWRVEYYTEDGSYMEPLNLTYDQGKQLAEAIRADIEAGALGGNGISWPHENLPVDLILRYYYGDAVSECGLSLTKEAEATCAVLREIGIPETVFEP